MNGSNQPYDPPEKDQAFQALVDEEFWHMIHRTWDGIERAQLRGMRVGDVSA